MRVIEKRVPERDVEDVLQDVYLSLLTAGFAGRSAPETFIATIVTRRIADYHRREAKWRNGCLAFLEMGQGTFLREEDYGIEDFDFNILTDKQRETVEQRLQGYRLTEIAERTGSTYETIRSRWRLGVKKLRKAHHVVGSLS